MAITSEAPALRGAGRLAHVVLIAFRNHQIALVIGPHVQAGDDSLRQNRLRQRRIVCQRQRRVCRFIRNLPLSPQKRVNHGQSDCPALLRMKLRRDHVSLRHLNSSHILASCAAIRTLYKVTPC